jgi:FixJ family two-component response regulator
VIAVVDDDSYVRRAIARVLRSAGYAVEEYFAGAVFLGALTDCRPDCVVLDLRMSVLSGFEVQEAIGRAGNNIPVIVVTAEHTAENIARATKLGALCCLRKPVDASRLLEEVRKACARLSGNEFAN